MNGRYITPAVTAFDDKGNLDRDALKKLYDHLIKGGVDGILILGSIGEFFALTMDQKKELIQLAVSHIAHRTQVLVGTASMDVNETLELNRYAIGEGADGVMVISPYYFTLSDQRLEAYYDYVVKECPGNFYLYNFPDRTGYDLSPQVALNLVRKHKNIVGIKDTLAGVDHTREMIKLIKPEFPEFLIYSGFDDNFAHNVLSGGDGCVAGLSNLAPELCSSWVKAVKANDLVKTSQIQQNIDKLMSIYQVGRPFVPYIKKAMILRGIAIQEHCSFPLLKATEAETEKVKSIMEQAGIL